MLGHVKEEKKHDLCTCAIILSCKKTSRYYLQMQTVRGFMQQQDIPYSCLVLCWLKWKRIHLIREGMRGRVMGFRISLAIIANNGKFVCLIIINSQTTMINHLSNIINSQCTSSKSLEEWEGTPVTQYLPVLRPHI